MLTETLSGNCPCCGYDKLLQRYGSQSYFQMDGCINCGFGYGTNHHDEHSLTPSFEHWRGYAIHTLVCKEAKGEDYPEVEERIAKMDDEEIRYQLFLWAEDHGRVNDVEGTVFVYPPSDIEEYLATNPTIFKEAE